MANVTVRVDVRDQASSVALDGVTVRVFQSDGTTFVTEGVTGSPFISGRVEFTLFGDTSPVNYVIRLSRTGYSFPLGATQTIGVTDPPNPDNDFGPYGAQGGTNTSVVTFNTIDQQSPAQPIANVQLLVYSSSDTFLTEVNTGSSGTATLSSVGSTSPGTS